MKATSCPPPRESEKCGGWWKNNFMTLCKLKDMNFFGSSIPPQKEKEDLRDLFNYYKSIGIQHIISHQSCGSSDTHCYDLYGDDPSDFRNGYFRCMRKCPEEDEELLIPPHTEANIQDTTWNEPPNLERPEGSLWLVSRTEPVITSDNVQSIIDTNPEKYMWNVLIEDMTHGSIKAWMALYELYKQIIPTSQVLVHCYAGFGRTGTTLLLFHMLKNCDQYKDRIHLPYFGVSNNQNDDQELRSLITNTIKQEVEFYNEQGNPEVRSVILRDSQGGASSKDHMANEVTNLMSDMPSSSSEESSSTTPRSRSSSGMQSSPLDVPLSSGIQSSSEMQSSSGMQSSPGVQSSSFDMLSSSEIPTSLTPTPSSKIPTSLTPTLSSISESSESSEVRDDLLVDLFYSRFVQIILLMAIHLIEGGEEVDQEIRIKPIYVPVKRGEGSWEWMSISYDELCRTFGRSTEHLP